MWFYFSSVLLGGSQISFKSIYLCHSVLGIVVILSSESPWLDALPTPKKKILKRTWVKCNGHEFEQTLGDSEGQGSLPCCSTWDCEESDTTEQLNHHNKEISSWIVWVGPV